MPKGKTQYKCLPQIRIESILRTSEPKYHPQVFLEECKYEVKNIRRIKRIDYGFEKSSSDESENEPDSDADDNELSSDYQSDNNES